MSTSAENLDAALAPTAIGHGAVAAAENYEQLASTIPFEELTQQVVADHSPITRPEDSAKPEVDVSHFFTLVRSEDGQLLPQLGALFNPALPRGRDVHGLSFMNYGIDDASSRGLPLDQHPNQPNSLDVYTVAVADILDPTFDGEIEELKAASCLVARDKSTAKAAGSWIVDPELRQNILDYAANMNEVSQARRLRQAFSGRPITGYLVAWPDHKQTIVTYDYQGIKQAVEERNGDNRFTVKDVEWLEAYMKHRDIPIPA